MLQILPLDEGLRRWAAAILIEHWGSTSIVTRGRIHKADRLPGFVALWNGEPAGLLTYRIEGTECEIVSLNSLREGLGIGSALLQAVEKAARKANCTRLWLITTNDNLPAIGFYQRRNFAIAAVYPNALAESRRLKPEIPLIGRDGIPLRDEIELEKPLASA